MKGGNYIKTFFDRKYLSTLDTKLDYIPFKRFIEDVHKRICDEIILADESYILPFKLGEIHISKEKKDNGVMTQHSKIKLNDKEYNEHSFGFIYKIGLDKKLRLSLYNNYTRSMINLLPKYKGVPVLNYDCYAFTPSREDLKRPLARKIKNKEYL